MRDKAFQEDRARECQEVEELRRICCAEAHRARQLKYDELSTQQKENPSTLNLLMVQIQKLQDKVNSFNDAKEFCDPETASSSGLYHIPSQPMSIPAAIHACSLMHGTACVCVHEDTFLNVHLLEVNHPQHSSRKQ